MGEERYRFKEENGEVMGGGSGKGGNGCYVSTGVGFLLTLLAVAISVGVGLIVHFAEKDKVIECRVETPEGVTAVQGALQGSTVPPSSCRQQILSGGSSLCDLCPREVTTGGPPMMTTPTPGGNKGNNSLRLPTAVKPLYYDLELQPNMYGSDPEAFTFDGHVTIHLECLTSTQEVVLHAKRLTIHKVEFTVETGSSSPAYVTHDLDPSRDLLIVRLSQRLEVGGHYALHVQFSGALKGDLDGLYLSHYTRNGQTVYLATTQFESADARRAFPCFDEPQFKAHYNVTLVRRSDLVSISNMPILHSDARAGGMVADVYQTTPLMASYLLAFIVCDFKNINVTESNGFMYRIWARPDAQDQIEYALNIGPKILHHYEEYFNISFPLPKQDMIGIPDFASGAMENWGLITYRESNILYKANVTSPSQKLRVTDVIAHELAHMWFGDLVTMQWWDDIWLNEGFASLVEYIGMDFLYPEWRVFDQFVYDSVQSTFSYDSHTSSHPITILGIEDLDKIEENFDTISYEKAGSVLRMLRFFLGEETFRRGVVNYLSAHKYSNAKHDDLWAALSEQTGSEGRPLDVADIMNTWILQMNFPVVMVTRDGNDLVLSQQRFLSNPDDKDEGTYTSPYGYKWTIPFTFTTSTERKFNATYTDVYWMRKEEPIVRLTNPKPLPNPAQGGWVLANIRSYGVYRVNYDYDNWRALIQQLKRDPKAIYSTNRAQIINDAWSLAGASMLDIDVALETVEYLDRERDYVPWASASSELSSVKKRLVHTEIYGAFLKFLQNKTEQLYSVVGMNENSDLLESYLQSTIVRMACGAGLPQCVQDATRLFADWKSNPDNVTVLPPQLRYRVFCTAAREGSAEDWEFLFRQYRKTTVPDVRSDLMEALTCTSRPWLLSSILDQVTNTTLFKKMDVAQMVYYVTQNDVGQPLAWEWVKANWPLIVKDYSSSASTLARLAKGAVDTFDTDHQIQELEAWMSGRDLGKGQRAFGQALEIAKANRKWMEVSYPKVKAWLTRLGFFQNY